MTVEEYKEFVGSLGLKTFGEDLPVAPKCLAAKAKLVQKYYNVWWLYGHREITKVLSVLTPKILVMIFFDCPEEDVVSISRRAIDIIDYDDGYPIWKMSSEDTAITCSFDSVQAECDKLLESQPEWQEFRGPLPPIYL